MKSTNSTKRLSYRRNMGNVLQIVFLSLTILAVLVLGVLLGNIIDRSFGISAIEYVNRYEDISADGALLEDSDDAALIETIVLNLRPRTLDAFEAEKPLDERTRIELLEIMERELLQPSVVRSWSLRESLFGRKAISAELQEVWPDANPRWRSWVRAELLLGSQSMDPLYAGIRGAIIGTFITILITMFVALPLGVGAAIWLEEYAPDNKLTRFIQTNIYNLAGVPSIIYGMLGLSIFVRYLVNVTQGRTILSAALTLAVLILPIVIINTQEAIKAVPQSLRHASLALGASQWQTIRHHVLPACMDRILTGAILGLSRAIGETAPLVVVGASTFLTHDPTSVYERFTTLPGQISQWTSLPGDAWRNLAGASILILMILLLGLNSFAIILRNRYRKEMKA